jgi:hypothetical protein
VIRVAKSSAKKIFTFQVTLDFMTIDASLSGGPHAFRPKTPFRERMAFHPKTAPNRSGTADWSAK